MRIYQQRILAIYAGMLASDIALASVPNVPEMDAGGVAVALGLTIALVMLIKDRRKK